ncbi:hypothetical protein diail_9924 [Diaporthe ilicicola]|nr:hypothetical protein diail_9924 [Diaporthe ilicicola]
MLPLVAGCALGALLIGASTAKPTPKTEDAVVRGAYYINTSYADSGSGGLFLTGAGAMGKGVTPVGSVDSTELGLGLVLPFGWEPGTPAFGNVSLPLYAVSNNTSVEDDACNPLPDSVPDLSGYVTLVRQGYCSDYIKAQNIAAKGARYMLAYSYYDDAESLSGPWVGEEEPRIVGTGVVTAAQAAEWVDALNQGSAVTVDIAAPAQAGSLVESTPNNKNGAAMSLFSSWGPTWEMDLKPTISAPGGYILSTWPLALGGYAIQSGTSMSTPLVSPIFALIGQARQDFDPQTLNNLITSTAAPVDWYDGNVISSTGVLAPPTQQGGGMAQAHRAAHATTLVSVSSISFDDTANFIPSVSFTINKQGAEQVTYSLGTVEAETMYTFNPGNSSSSGGSNTTAAEPLGTFGTFPMEHVPRAYFINAFTGMLTDGTIAPEGTYAFVTPSKSVISATNFERG